MSEKKPSALSETLEAMSAKVKENRANQPKVGAEMRAVFRQGREDAWNNLIPAFPQTGLTREAGAPGTPTPQQTTEALEGREVNEQDKLVQEVASKEKNVVTKEEVEKELARTRGNQQSRGR